jgi:hypothetical protein
MARCIEPAAQQMALVERREERNASGQIVVAILVDAVIPNKKKMSSGTSHLAVVHG